MPADAAIPPIISVEALTIGWGSFVLQREATFEIAQGEIFVILGGSGCGKSTLLRHLIGLQAPLSGKIHIDGIGASATQSTLGSVGAKNCGGS